MKKKMLFALSTLILAALGLAACAPASFAQGVQGIPAVQFSQAGKIAGVSGEFTGLVSVIAPDHWIIAGTPVQIDHQTVIDGTFSVGDTAKAQVRVDAAGTITASRIESASLNDGQPTLEATLASTPEGTEDNPEELVGVVQAMSPDSWTISGQVIAVTSQTEIKDGIQLGDTVKVHAFTAADGTLTASEIERVDEPQFTQTPGAENNDGLDNEKTEFNGTIEAIQPGMWTISGTQVAVTADTEIKGSFMVGDMVKVEAFVNPDGSLTAREIQALEENSISGSGHDSSGSGSDDGSVSPAKGPDNNPASPTSSPEDGSNNSGGHDDGGGHH